MLTEMLDFAQARRMMVDSQVRTSDVTDPSIIEAMLDIPRERFAPDGKAELAYLDLDLPLATAEGQGRCMLKPMVLSKLIQAAEVTDTSRALVVGCGTGYSAALLARLAASVLALEEDAALARVAANTLSGLGVAKVAVETGPLIAGAPKSAPYDVMLIEGAVEHIPDALSEQLADGGRLACVLKSGPAGKAMLYRRAAGTLTGRPIFEAWACPLPAFAAPRAFIF